MNLTIKAVNFESSLWCALQDVEQEELRGGATGRISGISDYWGPGKVSGKPDVPKPTLLDAFKHLTKEQVKEKQEEWNMTDADIYAL